MSRNYFEDLPPELIIQLSPLLPSVSLNSLVLTCRRLHAILQPELETVLTDSKLGRDVLLAAAACNLCMVAKLLAPPHLINPNDGYNCYDKTPLHVAVKSRRRDIAALLLEAGADTSAQWHWKSSQPLHLAALNQDLEMMKLLLEHDARINATFGADDCSQSALHYACSLGHLEMGRLLLDYGADLECHGHFGTALGFAVHRGDLDMAVLLLEKGANAEVTVPLFTQSLIVRQPRHANLLYISMQLLHPSFCAHRKTGTIKFPKWIGLPLSESKKKLMAVLLTYGASKDAAMETIVRHLTTLAWEANNTESEFLAVVTEMLNEAENATVTTQQHLEQDGD